MSQDGSDRGRDSDSDSHAVSRTPSKGRPPHHTALSWLAEVSLLWSVKRQRNSGHSSVSWGRFVCHLLGLNSSKYGQYGGGSGDSAFTSESVMLGAQGEELRTNRSHPILCSVASSIL